MTCGCDVSVPVDEATQVATRLPFSVGWSVSRSLSDLRTDNIVCFAAGNLSETTCGLRPVEALQKSDLINTLEDRPQEIRWIGGAKVKCIGPHAPISIKRGAIPGPVRPVFFACGLKKVNCEAGALVSSGNEIRMRRAVIGPCHRLG
ncbi:Hint domain-containing protein [Roseovarius sp.]